MANSCKITPTVKRRTGTKLEEKKSKLFQDIKEAVQDYETAWKMWAYTKTTDFKQKYTNLEYDELGEVTFPSLINALGLQVTYDTQKSIRETSRDYGFTDTVFPTSDVAMSQVEGFNAKEKKYIAFVQKVDGGYAIRVVPKVPSQIEKARQQSYNHALTGEIISLLNSIGFNVEWVSNPKFDGLFDPTNAKLYGDLLTVISIAKGELGEQALPEEFSHLIIEGLTNHPLVQRLLASITDAQIQDTLGDDYERYNLLYQGDSNKMKKEAAGKMLAEYITKQGTISKPVIRQKEGLLSRIWNWAKRLFAKITGKQLNQIQEQSYNAIADIYNLVASGEVVSYIDKSSILNGDQLAKLSEQFADLEKVAHSGEFIVAKMLQIERRSAKNSKATTITSNALKQIQEKNDNDDSFTAIKTFLNYAEVQIRDIYKKQNQALKAQNDPSLKEIQRIDNVAKIVNDINNFISGYESILMAIASFADEGVWDTQLGLRNQDVARALANAAKGCLDVLNSLKNDKEAYMRNVVYNASRTVYKEDRVRGIGKKRDEVMALGQILEHADRDINFVDRWLSAMSDADDALLVIFDQLVKNQQYERDMEMIEWRAKIADVDEKLRRAGYSSDFMFERNKEGVPTGRIISNYDWDGYNAALKAEMERLREEGFTGKKFTTKLNRWKNGADSNGNHILLDVFVDPEIQAYNEQHGTTATLNKYPDAIYERVPNPAVFTGKANTLSNLSAAQRQYYDAMIEIKRQMMTKIPHRGQGIYKAIYISKDFAEGILDSTNPLKATLDHYKRKFVRRPDDIGFGTQDNLGQIIQEILRSEDDTEAATERIIGEINAQLDNDIRALINPKSIERLINRYKRSIKDGSLEKDAAYEKATDSIIELLANSEFAIVDTDFANHRVQRLPIYYTRPLRDMNMLSTDFSGSILAYSAMAVNYEKMNEVVDILEVGREFIHQRDVKEKEGNRSVKSKFDALGKMYSTFVTKAGNGSAIAGRYDDWMDSVVYEERKDDEGGVEVLGVNIDVAKTLDTIKDYTGLLGLGFNLFATISNVSMGKLQQWIEAYGGEYFKMKHYAKAVTQYSTLIPGCMAEMNNPVKKNKLSLLIQMFDPMGDYFENLRDPNFNKNPLTRILGNGVLAYIGMNAGEHMLHCQTMLAILNAIELTDTTTGRKVSLFDALEVKERDGIYRLELQPNLSYQQEVIDNTGTAQSNKNFGKPLKDENGKIKTEWIQISNTEGTKDPAVAKQFTNFIFKKKKVIRKVNDSLNGAFSANDKGALHKKAVGRLVLQFRQWMPAHYMRRFARGHYDADLEQWREGYYVTVVNVINQLAKDIKKGQLELLKMGDTLSEHEKANLRRATAEVSEFLALMVLIRIGGRVKDRDRSWLNKMALYQLHRMHLEVGASMPVNGEFFNNIFTLLQSPAASLKTFENFSKVLNIWNMFDEIESGRYQGWSEWERDAFKALPALGQIVKAIDFDESMFSMFEED